MIWNIIKSLKKYNYGDRPYEKLCNVKSNKNKIQNYLYIMITTLYTSKSWKNYIYSLISGPHIPFRYFYLFSFTGKIQERVFFICCLYFLSTHYFLNPTPSGFLPSHSTITTFVKIISNFTWLNPMASSQSLS